VVSGQRKRKLFSWDWDEEDRQTGSRTLAASGFKADLAIVGEPTSVRVVTAHKGSLWLRLETRGKSAHGSRPELGRNAVHEMSKIVDLLETDYADSLRQRRHPLLGCATVSVGVIAGGNAAKYRSGPMFDPGRSPHAARRN
jgi:acetylornithine deacetylase/succinyl-diaminopimelate desuccinylase-like protein